MTKLFLPRLITVIIVQLLVCILPAKAQTVCDPAFFKSFTGNGNLEPYVTKQLINGEILVAGRVSTANSSSNKAMAVKFSATGTVLWSSETGGAVNDQFTGAIELADNSYLLYGVTESFGYTQGKILLTRINNAGTIIWSRQLGTASPGKEQIKSLLQYSDGDLIGTFNTNESTNQSDPIVFKIGLNGVLKWAKRFDNGGEESLSSIAFNANNIYVGGFYTVGNKRGVLTKLSSADGSVVSSLNIYHNDSTYDQELNQLEIINNKQSYGLKLNKLVGNYFLHKIILIQSDLNGANKTFETVIENNDDTNQVIYKRTPDEGFMVLQNRYSPIILKFNRYNQMEWSTLQAENTYNLQRNYGMDITPMGGSISAGYYKNYLTNGLNRMVVMKTNAMGKMGGCTQPGGLLFRDTVTQRQRIFNWGSVTTIIPEINETLSLTALPLVITPANICDTLFCTDTTALPAGCNATMFTEYSSQKSLVLRDAITTSDGGRVGVGTMQQNGWIVKLKNNGDIDWSKQVDEFDRTHDFLRVIKSSDNKILAFANNYYTIANYVYRVVKVVKMDNTGSVIFAKELNIDNFTEIADVAATPDGGFVVILNGCHGCGYLYSHVIRYDAAFSILWKKEIKHSALTPIYRSLFCNENGVWFGHDTYDNYNRDAIGVQKLNYTTGAYVWNKRFSYGNADMRFNKLMVSADTVYAFSYKTDRQNGQTNIVMLKLKDDGAIIASTLLQTNPLATLFTYNYIDVARPTVTLTPQNDFVMSNLVTVNNSKALNISRFDKNGVPRWSRNYSGLTQHNVFNIHSQGTGTLILGTVSNPSPTSAFFSKAFILKVDSMGVVNSGATGTCANTNSSFTPLPYPITEADSRIDSVVNNIGFSTLDRVVSPFEQPVDASLYCNKQSVCTNVQIAKIGNGCGSPDTLVYYLTNNSCGVTAKWQYDTSYFTLIQSSGDSLKLIAKRAATSLIKAEIEDDCSVYELTSTATISNKASSLNLGADRVICPGNAGVLLHAGVGYRSYLWNNNSTDSTLMVTSPGLYFVKVIDSCGNIGRDSIAVSQAGADFMITGTAIKCNADTVRLQATPGYINYSWSPSTYLAATGNVANVAPPATLKYYVQAEKLPGCIVIDSFLVTVNTSPPLNLGADKTVCFDKSVQLTAAPGFTTYLWNTGSFSNSITAINAGTYTIEATYLNNCLTRDTVNVFKYPFTNPQLGKDTVICNTSSYLLQIGNYKQYLWNTGATSQNIKIDKAGEYWVKITDNNGCVATDSITISSKDCLKGFYIPTAFSPNNDGKNDILKPILLGNIKKYEFYIYNRWGQPVFYTTDPAKGWDGKFKSLDTEGNVFVWTCIYQFEGEAMQNKKGTVVMIR